MIALIQSENHAANKGKTAGRYQFDTSTKRPFSSLCVTWFVSCSKKYQKIINSSATHLSQNKKSN